MPALVLGLLAACQTSPSPSGQVASPTLPSVSGAFGSKPTLVFTGGDAPRTLQSKILQRGVGRAVANGDLLVADYLGQVWRGGVFADSYDGRAPAGMLIGRGKVLTGWDDALVGVPVGSRVVMSLPPKKAYGSAGNPRAGVRGNATLVFVVDVVAAYNGAARGEATAVPQRLVTPGVVVIGAPGGVPQVQVWHGARAPRSTTVSVLARGTGAVVGPGLLVVQYVARRYAGGSAGSTFARGAPAAVTVARPSSGRPFDQAIGLPLGSRILLEVPARKGHPAIAAVVDLVAQPRGAAASR